MLAFLGIVVPSSFGFYVPTYPQEPDFTAVSQCLGDTPLMDCFLWSSGLV